MNGRSKPIDSDRMEKCLYVRSAFAENCRRFFPPTQSSSPIRDTPHSGPDRISNSDTTPNRTFELLVRLVGPFRPLWGPNVLRQIDRSYALLATVHFTITLQNSKLRGVTGSIRLPL